MRVPLAAATTHPPPAGASAARARVERAHAHRGLAARRLNFGRDDAHAADPAPDAQRRAAPISAGPHAVRGGVTRRGRDRHGDREGTLDELRRVQNDFVTPRLGFLCAGERASLTNGPGASAAVDLRNTRTAGASPVGAPIVREDASGPRLECSAMTFRPSIRPSSGFGRYGHSSRPAGSTFICSIFLSWSQPGSNRRPPACKAGALPSELWPLDRAV